jgi:multidrug efflux pump
MASISSPSSAGRSAPRCWRSGFSGRASSPTASCRSRAVPNVDFPMIRVFREPRRAPTLRHGGDGRAPLERRLGEIAGVDRDHLDQLARHTSISCSSTSAATSTAPRATCRPRSTPRWPICRATCRRCRASARPIPRRRRYSDPGADLEDDAAERDVRRRRHRDRAAHLAGRRRRRGHRQRRRAAGGAHRAQSGGARRMPGCDRRRALAIVNANPLGPVGIFDGGRQSETIVDQRAAAHRGRIPRHGGQELANGNFVRLSDVADVEDSVRNSRSIAWFNKQPAVLLQITKQGDANVIDTVDRIRALLPELKRWIPGRRRDFDLSTAPAPSAPASRHAADAARHAFLVMLVVFVFLRRRRRRSRPASRCRWRWPAPAPGCGSPVSRSTICR